MLTQKQEVFCINYFETGNATQSALTAGYSPKTAVQIASINLTKVDIQERLKELRAKVANKKIANVVERQERLSVFLREDNYTKTGRSRQSNIQAADILNKMEKIYEATAPVSQDNRVINIIVMDKETKELIKQVAGRTGKLIEAVEEDIDATE